jgi:hypothetical protein
MPSLRPICIPSDRIWAQAPGRPGRRSRSSSGPDPFREPGPGNAAVEPVGAVPVAGRQRMWLPGGVRIPVPGITLSDT